MGVGSIQMANHTHSQQNQMDTRQEDVEFLNKMFTLFSKYRSFANKFVFNCTCQGSSINDSYNKLEKEYKMMVSTQQQQYGKVFFHQAKHSSPANIHLNHTIGNVNNYFSDDSINNHEDSEDQALNQLITDNGNVSYFISERSFTIYFQYFQWT